MLLRERDIFIPLFETDNKITIRLKMIDFGSKQDVMRIFLF